MSYIRCAWPLKYVKGKSSDYVYSNGQYIEDYGKISDTGFIELLYRHWKTDDLMFKEHLLKRLAQRLKVTLREKPLTEKETIDIMMESVKRFDKLWKKHKIQ